MSSSRRDFLKGIAAAAAAVPCIALGRRVKVEPEPMPEAQVPIPISQRHGEQPEFYITEWKVTHDADIIEEIHERHFTLGRCLTHVQCDLYAPDPIALSAWCSHHGYLIMDFPPINLKVKVLIRTFEMAHLDINDRPTVWVEGIVEKGL